MFSEIANRFWGFVAGILSSVIASYVYAWWQTRARRHKYKSLEGVWIEANSLLEDRPFAICQFFFAPSDGGLRFEGYSYDNNANPYYKWWSIVLHIDDDLRRLSYIYETHPVVENLKKDEGFGCIFLNFDTAKATWNIENGYFMDLGEAKPRFSRMQRFEDVAKLFKRDLNSAEEADRRLIIQELLYRKDTNEIIELFGLQ